MKKISLMKKKKVCYICKKESNTDNDDVKEVVLNKK